MIGIYNIGLFCYIFADFSGKTRVDEKNSIERCVLIGVVIASTSCSLAFDLDHRA